MTFAEAMERVRRGFKVRRPHWTRDAWIVPHYVSPTSVDAEPWWNHGGKYWPDTTEQAATDWEGAKQ